MNFVTKAGGRRSWQSELGFSFPLDGASERSPEGLVAWRASSLRGRDTATSRRRCDASEEGDGEERFHRAHVQAVAFYSVTSKSLMGFLAV